MRHAYLTLIGLLFLCMKAFAYDCEVDGIYYYRISATDLEVANKVFSDQNRSAYTGSVTIPATVTYLGKTFNVVSIGEYAFRDCTQLTSITIPNSVRTIKSYAFYNCTQIAAIHIPESVMTIEDGAFEGCSQLAHMVIPNGVPEVADNTFYGCASMKTVVLPSSISSIGADAFNRCTSLISIYIMNETPPICGTNAFDKVDRTWCTIYVAKNSKAYENDNEWRSFFIEEFNGGIDKIPLNIVQ